MSLISASAGTVTPFRAAASKFPASAVSIPVERNTPSLPAPVTAARTAPSLPRATNTPTMA